MHWYDRLLLLWQLLLHANVPEFVLFLAWPPACEHSHVLRILDCESAIYIMACALYQSIQTPKVAISSCPTTATTGTECNSIVISHCDLCLMQARHVACTMPHTPSTLHPDYIVCSTFAKLSGHYVSVHTTKNSPQIFRQGVPAVPTVPALPNEWACNVRN